MTHILMVCMGNICRSPTASSVALQLVRQRGLAGIQVDSAGTHAYHVGQRMDARAQAALLKRQYSPVKTRSRQIGVQDFQRFDLILAMDEDNLAALQKLCPVGAQHKLSLLLSFAPGLGTLEVPDPYYGGPAGFERVLDLCEVGVKGLLTQLQTA
jgi:protein-tyrosine phosphatase